MDLQGCQTLRISETLVNLRTVWLLGWACYASMAVNCAASVCAVPLKLGNEVSVKVRDIKIDARKFDGWGWI